MFRYNLRTLLIVLLLFAGLHRPPHPSDGQTLSSLSRCYSYSSAITYLASCGMIWAADCESS